MDHLELFPLPFFLGILLIVGLGFYAWTGRREGWGLPAGMVLMTVGVWYHGDGLYNEYDEYLQEMGEDALAAGWWQVVWFLVVFGVLVQPVNRLLNQRWLGNRSRVMTYYETDLLLRPETQRQIDRVAWLLFYAWLALMLIALLRVKFNFIGLFAPYLGQKESPWARGRMGGGIDAVLSLAGYVQILLTASFGVFAGLARNPSTRTMALTVCALAFPFYLFDRTRNAMIAVMLPGLLAWVFFRLRFGLIGKGAVLLVAFMFVNFWFSFVIANRNAGSIAGQFGNEAALEKADDAKHEGLSMFSELGYMNMYFAQGTLEPNWGHRYFAEAVNMVPRALWPGKPTAGLDYAEARGFASGKAGSDGGVTASIASGMIGQGVLNFGVIGGPMAAAFLMSLWVGLLARQDLLGRDPARMLLYAVGMILTFNMGRDITLIVLYPFFFGLIGLKVAIQLGFYEAPSSVAPRRPRRRPEARETEPGAGPGHRGRARRPL